MNDTRIVDRRRRSTLVLSPALLVCAWLVLLSAFFVAMTAVNLSNFRPVSADDIWILSASYKLATQGIFGSDMYAGFFGADRHYFIALPVQHVLQATSFQMFGAGIAQARAVSVFSGVLLIWTVTWLAWRWYGGATAVLTGLLLVFWRPALIATAGVPLVRVARTTRYDLTAVAAMWLTVLCLDALLRRPTRGRALAVGVSAGIAALTQFFGAFIIATVALVWIWEHRRRVVKLAHTWWIIAGAALLIGPYFAYVGAHRTDATAQTLYVKGERIAFGVHALLTNLLNEPMRYRYVLDVPDAGVGRWVLMVGIWPALLYLGLRLWRGGTIGDRLLAASVGVTVLLLGLIDTTAAPLYALSLLPALVVILASFLVRIGSAVSTELWPARIAVNAGVLVVVAVIVAQGVDFYRHDRRAASTVTPYEQIGEQLHTALPTGASVAGAERWWWALRDYRYLAVNNLWLRWEVEQKRRERPRSIAAIVGAADVDYVLVNDNVRGDVSHRPEELQRQFWSYLERCTWMEGEWRDSTYGHMTLHAVTPTCR